MSAAVPTSVPEQLTAGTTATWRTCLPDYPASDGWLLTYVLLKIDTGLKILIEADASGSDHLVEVAAADTTWTPGEYSVQGYVSNTAPVRRHLVYKGSVTILPDFATSDGVDTRTTARKTLDAIEAAILTIHEAAAAGRSGSIVEWTVEGMHIRRSSPELLQNELVKQRDRWRAIVNQEEILARRASGRATGQRILTQFVR